MKTSERFAALWMRLCAAPTGQVWLELDCAYREPQRAYHNWAHIEAMLSGLDACSVLPEFASVRFDEVEAAIWFHDVIYAARAKDNEEKSAEMFRRAAFESGVDADRIALIVAMILATKSHGPSADISTRLLLDLDLEVLGRPPADYESYVSKVRQEYHFVPDDQWRAGRAAVLRMFLERPAIFQTHAFLKLEKKARHNIQREIEELEG